MTDKPAETGTELTTFTPDNPVAILTDAAQFDALLGKIELEVANHQYDLTTPKGRKAIGSLAYKVTRTKTALDDAGKELNASKRAEIDAVDAVRREVRAKLDALADKARKPLDEWEAKEAKRQELIRERILFLDTIVMNGQSPDASASYIAAELLALEKMEFDADIFLEWLEIAVKKKADALTALRGYHERAVKAEADAAELARLRKEAADREAADADRIAEETRRREATAKAEADAKAAAEAEAKRVADAAAAETKRLKDIADASEAARVAERAKADRETADKVAAAQAETDRLRKADEARLAADAQAKKEQEAREADQAHRSAILKAAKEAIMEQGGVTEPQARAIVLAIKGGLIPAVILKF